MRRPGGERVGGSARVFVRPVAMLAIGLAAGLAMWRILMADEGPVRVPRSQARPLTIARP